MKRKIVVGIDTSNYTTSVALITTDGELVANIKRPLPVKTGERGLRQSDAVFAHIKNLPSAMEEAKTYMADSECVAIGVSEKPRNAIGSYMPCFLSGVAAAESVSALCSAPIYKFSHQCGHIMAALYSSKRFDLFDKTFCAVHVSGGTTEMLRVTPTDFAFSCELVGGTADLNAGQVIDRIGVHMGLQFPAGREIEALALENSKKLPSAKPKLTDMRVNLSGLENMAVKLYSETNDERLVSAFVLDYISKGLSLLAESYITSFGESEFVFAGGVMSNSIIKNNLRCKFNASFAEPALSADNAVGIAYLALKRFNSEK